MSKNLTIDEGGESRHFDGVKRLKTKLAGEDGGSCYWVPEDETQAWPTFIMDNGMHVAAEEGHYGYSEANVNVFIPTPFPEWNVWIDDIDVPHIHIDDITIGDWHIDDIELTIDPDLGTPIVDLDGIDMDGFEIPDINIYMPGGSPISDIDFRTDIHVWTDPDDHTKIHVKEEPNGEEIVLDYDDIDGTATFKGLLDFRYDDSTGKWIIEAHTKIKVDDVVYEAGDEIKSWSKETVVDFTMKVEQEISVDFPDLDPDFMDDFDIDLDMDNMDLEMDGIDMDIDMPLLKMPDLDDELPDEIRIMHVPDKTSYKDGEAIDLDGIVVQAYKDGAVWQNNKYVNGYIPAHELSINPAIAGAGGKIVKRAGDISFYGGLSFSGTFGGVPFPKGQRTSARTYSGEYVYIKETRVPNVGGGQFLFSGIILGFSEVVGSVHKTVENKYSSPRYEPDFDGSYNLIGGVATTPAGATIRDKSGSPVYVADFGNGSIVSGWWIQEEGFSCNPSGISNPNYAGWYLARALVSALDNKTLVTTNTITVSWDRPLDGKILSDTFDITIDPNE